MKVELLEDDRKRSRMVLLIKDSSVPFVNALRRTAVEDVPTLAIEDVEFRRNSSVLYDEMIAHRLGLIPLSTDLALYSLAGPSKEGSEGSIVKFTLKAAGPCMVYASDLESSDQKVKPIYPAMPLVKLMKGQKLELEATAQVGTGREHMKWAPGLAYYRHMPKSIRAGSSEKAREIAARFPKGVVTAQANKLSLDTKKLVLLPHLDSVEALSEGAITAEDSESDFVFFIESWGQLSPKEILAQACAILKEQATSLENDLEESSGGGTARSTAQG